MIGVLIHQEVTIFINMQLITVSKHVKQKFNRIVREISYTVTVGDFNIFI